MELDREHCHRALRTRDVRFDGRFFTGVKSTGIYCRPICPARTPRPENCDYFATAAAAEAAGFRPCLRCRPEASPGTPAWQGTTATVTRALRLIEDGALDQANVDDLAARLGVGARHLRRLFVSQLGAAPRAIALTRRVHLARQLLAQTTLPIEAIALAAGFASARRLRAAFAARCGRSPLAFRCAPGRPEPMPGLRLRLSYRPPLAWDAMLTYLARRAIPGVEAVAGGRYCRTLQLGAASGVLMVAHDPDRRCLEISVPLELASAIGRIVARVRAQFDLDADPDLLAEHLAGDPLLVDRPRGLRVPGAWDPFELAVRAVLGQQVSVAGATRLAGRLARTCGRPLPGGDAELALLFPTAAELTRIPVAAIAAIGMPIARAEAIAALARAVAAGEPLLEPSADLERAVARLTALPGWGPWTAHYVALRALREPDAFPAGDLHLRRMLAAGARPLAPAAARARAESWRPFRGYAAIYLWTSEPGG